MAPAPADRQLLLGLLALQNGLIDQGQLVATFREWSLDKSRTLADHLETQGNLSSSRRTLLEGLVEVHLETHGGDVGKSLAAVSAGKSTLQGLAALGDPEVEATLDHVGSAHGSTEEGEFDRTPSYAVGESTGDGQRFRILRPHKQGGLGAVFVALDSELNREVALKQILDHHADDPTSRHRFLIEAEINGGLEHPGIVPVYGLGTYAGGRPYYAMRFIKGDSLKEAIERFHKDESLKDNPGLRSLRLRELLRRFTDVCNAIGYAHSRGVLHRDIKPGNIIVGKHGETLVVDWGLAKAKGRHDQASAGGEATLMPSSASGSAETMPGQALGTPSFMSPEQARGDLAALGPRSDVYSLGATLYCLLTGKPPFDLPNIKEILLKVQKGDFLRPREANPSVDRALEAVCLKAMATDPDGRYDSCRALADDVDRWMADEPVAAWREPFATRARRWMRRRRTLVTSAVAASLAALIGLGAVAAVEARANGRLKSANNRLALSAERERERFDMAVEAIKTFHAGVSQDELLKEARFERLRKALLGNARDFYRKLEVLLKREGDPRSRGDLSDAFGELAKLTSEIESQDQGIALYRQAVAIDEALASGPEHDPKASARLARHVGSIGVLQAATREKEAALASYRKAMAIFERLSALHPENRAHRSELATVLHQIGVLQTTTGSWPEALAFYERSRALRQQLVDAEPANSEYQVDLASSDNNIGIVMREVDRAEEAEAAYRKCLRRREALVHTYPDEPRYQSALAQSHANLGFHYKMMRRPADSLAEYDRARSILEEVVAANSAVTRYQYELARIYGAMPLVRPPDDRALVRSDLERAIALFERVVAANPRVQSYRVDLTRTLNNMALVYEEEGLLAKALANCERTCQIRAEMAKESPNQGNFQADLAKSFFNCGEVLVKLDRRGDALQAYEEAARVRKALGASFPNHLPDQEFVAMCQDKITGLLVDLGKPAEALATHRLSLAFRRRIVDPSRPETLYNLACSQAQLSRFGNLEGSGLSPEDARAEADRALQNLTRAIALGFRDLEQYRSDTDLDPLRTRDDFQALMIDLAFPANPFAHGR